MKKLYSKPQIQIFKYCFEEILDRIDQSDPESSIPIIDIGGDPGEDPFA